MKEREDLLQELERLKAQAETTKYMTEVDDPHVSVTLEGVEYPERVWPLVSAFVQNARVLMAVMEQWQEQKAEFQTFDVKKGSQEWNEVENHFINGLGGGTALSSCFWQEGLLRWYFCRHECEHCAH